MSRTPSTTILLFIITSLTLLNCTKERFLYNKIQRLKDIDPGTYIKIQDCLQVIGDAYHQFSEDELALAFNGGKDCLVVFQLVKAYCERNHKKMPFLVYFERDDEFSEMIEFMFETVKNSQLEIHIACGGFKEGLAELKKQGMKAIFMGQRRNDPHAPPTPFALTTPGWPEIVRINPILDLDYAGVWAFLKGTNTKYCRLYDDGYTSLGSKSSTIKNSKLSNDNLGSNGFRPAHELKDGDDAERSGRI